MLTPNPQSGAPFNRPVKGEALLTSAELALCAPTEVELERRSVDEGVGTGFDLASPDAYAERVVTWSGDLDTILAWYRSELLALGWTERTNRAPSPEPVAQFSRNAGESVQVQVLPMQEFWSKWHGTASTVGRVSYSVAGNWPHDAPS